MKAAVPAGVTVWVFVAGAALAVIGALPLLALHLWISFAWGMGASVGISFGGLLMAAILGLTGLGSGLWPFIPWTWPVKLGMLAGTYFLKDAGSLSQTEITSGLIKTASTGLGAAAAGLILFLIGGMIWFNIWDGRKS